MADISDTGRDGFDARPGARVNAADVDDWFVREVLPLESALIQFLHRNWRNASDIPDLKQDIYVQVYQAALQSLPVHPRQFVFTTARNLLINRVKREQIVSIEAMADLDFQEIAEDAPGPDRTVLARDELLQLRIALDKLPDRHREIFVMAQIEGLTGRQIAERLGLAESTVSLHLAKATRLIADHLYGEPKDLRRSP
jgi:RNA polymerase sigma-70 factor (ECF subfamily)